MNHLTDAILAGAVPGLPNTFDSHELIRAVMTTHPQEYVRELYNQVNADDPIQSAHAAIGLALHRIPSIAPTRRVNSVNVRGQTTENQEWQKRVHAS